MVVGLSPGSASFFVSISGPEDLIQSYQLYLATEKRSGGLLLLRSCTGPKLQINETIICITSNVAEFFAAAERRQKMTHILIYFTDLYL